MRLFIAIDFPEKTKAELTQIINSLSNQLPQISWVKPENFHLTLKFLGYVIEEKIPQIKKGIEAVALKTKTFQLNFGDLGYFERNELIIFLDLVSDTKLAELVNNMEKQMETRGFIKEKRKFSPHITLGRGKRLDSVEINSIKKFITDFVPGKINPINVSDVTLMESILTQKGPVYQSLSNLHLPQKAL